MTDHRDIARHQLDQLDSTTWKTAGSTGIRPEGPTAKATEGSSPMNLTVLDHITAGRNRLAIADQAEAAGRSHRADIIRRALAAQTQTLVGDTSSVRNSPCPSCGTYSLLWRKAPTGRAVCANTLCSPVTTPRAWTLTEVMAATVRRPVRRFHAAGDLPRDLTSLAAAVAFFAETGHPVTISTLRRLATEYRLPRWNVPGQKAQFFSRSDLMVVHAIRVHTARGACDRTSERQQPACVGLSHLYTSTAHNQQARERAAAQLCAGCPMRRSCLDAQGGTE